MEKTNLEWGTEGGGTALRDDPQEQRVMSSSGALPPGDLLGQTRISLSRAGVRKRLKYHLIVDALEPLEDEGWKVEVLPWVSGVRGVLDVKGICQAANFLKNTSNESPSPPPENGTCFSGIIGVPPSSQVCPATTHVVRQGQSDPVEF